MLAPNGSYNEQITACMEKAGTFIGKIQHSKLTHQAKWTAIKTILEPGIMYPLMANLCIKKELDIIERTLIRAKCNAIGLNEQFLWASLCRPHCYGGMEIPMVHASKMNARVNCFLFHI